MGSFKSEGIAVRKLVVVCTGDGTQGKGITEIIKVDVRMKVLKRFIQTEENTTRAPSFSEVNTDGASALLLK